MLFLLVAGCDSSHDVAYKRIAINPITLVVDLQDPFPGIIDPQTDFYSLFYYPDGHRALEHVDTTTEHTPRTRYGSLELTADRRLISRSKRQIVLSGEFGTFYAELTFRYPIPATSSHTTTAFDVHAFSNNHESEPPQVSAALIPSDATLAGISVIRVLKAPNGYRLVAACYTPAGELLNFSENYSTEGDCKLGGSIDLGYASSEVDPVGMPLKFPMAAYLAGDKNVFAPSSQVSTLDCVTLHYNQNQLLWQDLFRVGQPVQSRTLTYKFTVEDAALASIDHMHPFGRVDDQ